MQSSSSNAVPFVDFLCVLQSTKSLLCDVLLGSNTSSDAPCLELEFEKFTQPVSFPSHDRIEEYARSLESTRLGEATIDYSEVV